MFCAKIHGFMSIVFMLVNCLVGLVLFSTTSAAVGTARSTILQVPTNGCVRQTGKVSDVGRLLLRGGGSGPFRRADALPSGDDGRAKCGERKKAEDIFQGWMPKLPLGGRFPWESEPKTETRGLETGSNLAGHDAPQEDGDPCEQIRLGEGARYDEDSWTEDASGREEDDLVLDTTKGRGGAGGSRVATSTWRDEVNVRRPLGNIGEKTYLDSGDRKENGRNLRPKMDCGRDSGEMKQAGGGEGRDGSGWESSRSRRTEAAGSWGQKLEDPDRENERELSRTERERDGERGMEREMEMERARAGEKAWESGRERDRQFTRAKGDKMGARGSNLELAARLEGSRLKGREQEWETEGGGVSHRGSRDEEDGASRQSLARPGMRYGSMKRGIIPSDEELDEMEAENDRIARWIELKRKNVELKVQREKLEAKELEPKVASQAGNSKTGWGARRDAAHGIGEWFRRYGILRPQASSSGDGAHNP